MPEISKTWIARPQAELLDVAEFPHQTRDWLAAIHNLDEMGIAYDAETGALWQYMSPHKPSITEGLLADALRVMEAVVDAHRHIGPDAVRYMVLASGLPGIYSLGGDLTLFKSRILEGDREALRHYAHTCIEVQYRRAIKMDLPICTIALVQGDALGGGFEAALAHDVIIAERGTKFGLPEILFNLFPGMGAYTFLSRRLDSVRAERLMTSGRLYSAEELYDIGLVDVLAEDGEGVAAVDAYIHTHRRSSKSRNAIAKLRRLAAPVTRQELIDITDLWVETALTLEARDLRKMEHLVAAQLRRVAAKGNALRATA